MGQTSVGKQVRVWVRREAELVHASCAGNQLVEAAEPTAFTLNSMTPQLITVPGRNCKERQGEHTSISCVGGAVHSSAQCPTMSL